MLIFGLISFTTISIFTFSEAFVGEIQHCCLRLFVVILQDLHSLLRFYHNVDHWSISFTITPIAPYSLAFVSDYRNACLRVFAVISLRKVQPLAQQAKAYPGETN